MKPWFQKFLFVGLLVCVMLINIRIGFLQRDLDRANDRIKYLEIQQSSMIHWNFLRNVEWLQNQDFLKELQNVED